MLSGAVLLSFIVFAVKEKKEGGGLKKGGGALKDRGPEKKGGLKERGVSKRGGSGL